MKIKNTNLIIVTIKVPTFKNILKKRRNERIQTNFRRTDSAKYEKRSIH